MLLQNGRMCEMIGGEEGIVMMVNEDADDDLKYVRDRDVEGGEF
jgi:hypothetical protein